MQGENQFSLSAELAHIFVDDELETHQLLAPADAAALYTRADFLHRAAGKSNFQLQRVGGGILANQRDGQGGDGRRPLPGTTKSAA